MVEITAGFMMMVIIMASFIKIIKLSSEMTEAAVDMKNNNLEFDRRYYTGYNYDVDGGTAFISGSGETIEFQENGATVPIKLTEWHKKTNDDYFEEWYKNGDKFKLSIPSGNKTIELNNIKLYHIENVRAKDMAKVSVYRYKYLSQ